MTTMKLGQRQELFSECFGKLLITIHASGYKTRHGDCAAKKRNPLEHIENSNHYIACAADINLFKDGKFLTKTEDHKAFGAFWESLHPLCRWGGRWNDGNHYEVTADDKWRTKK